MLGLHNENCLDTMARMTDNYIDLTVTSPPYDNLRTYNGFEFDWKAVLKNLYRVTKEGGVVVWVVGDATIKGSETGTSFKQALYAMECGFKLYDTMVWEKASRIPTQDRYYNVIEYMFIFSKGKPSTFNPIVDHKNKTFGAKKRKDKCINKGNNVKSDKIHVTGEFSRRSNIWKYGTHGNGTKHPAIFPEKLAADHILSWSNEGDIVYDPFIGSGTTAKMAILNNRQWIGSEISEEYCEIIEERIKNVNPKQIELF